MGRHVSTGKRPRQRVMQQRARRARKERATGRPGGPRRLPALAGRARPRYGRPTRRTRCRVASVQTPRATLPRKTRMPDARSFPKRLDPSYPSGSVSGGRTRTSRHAGNRHCRTYIPPHWYYRSQRHSVTATRRNAPTRRMWSPLAMSARCASAESYECNRPPHRLRVNPHRDCDTIAVTGERFASG